MRDSLMLTSIVMALYFAGLLSIRVLSPPSSVTTRSPVLEEEEEEEEEGDSVPTSSSTSCAYCSTASVCVVYNVMQ